MKGRVLLDEKQDVVLTQNAILFVECLIRARIGHSGKVHFFKFILHNIFLTLSNQSGRCSLYQYR